MPKKTQIQQNEKLLTQSSIQSRIEISTTIDQILKQHIHQDQHQFLQSCQDVYGNLFQESWVDGYWGKPKVLGQGNYGRVFQVTLKSLPSLPLALKKTNKMEISEAQSTILTSALVESGACPHFTIIYAHLHCEKPRKFLMSFADNNDYLPWLTGLKQIREIEKNIKILKETKVHLTKPGKSQILLMKKTIKQIESKMYADDESFLYFKNLKRDKELLMIQNYRDQKNIRDPAYVLDSKIIQAIYNNYEQILKQREKRYIPYEIFVMELADKNYKTWLGQKKFTVDQFMSSVFQICCGFLSLVSFYKLVQNDLLLHNIMFNYVEPNVSYVYKIGHQYYQVPLLGKLMKIIDFGLSVDVDKFARADGDGTLTHWCVGGEGTGPFGQRRCSPYLRDFLELFFRLNQFFNTINYDQIERLGLGLVQHWVFYAYDRAKQLVNASSVSDVIDYFVTIFQPQTFKKLGLNFDHLIKISYTQPPLQLEYQQKVFFITNPSMYQDKISTIVQSKISQA